MEMPGCLRHMTRSGWWRDMVGGESRGGGEVEKRREERGVCVMCNSWVEGRRRRRSELQSCRGVQVGAEKKLTEVGWVRARAPVTPDSKLLARVHCWHDSKGVGEFWPGLLRKSDCFRFSGSFFAIPVLSLSRLATIDWPNMSEGYVDPRSHYQLSSAFERLR